MVYSRHTPLKARRFEEDQMRVRVPFHIDELEEEEEEEEEAIDDDDDDYVAEEEEEEDDDDEEEEANYGNVIKQSGGVKSPRRELTLSFEGEVYVFHSVTPEKVQEVLQLLGGQDILADVPTNDTHFQQHNSGLNVASTRSNHSQRIASLVRPREKRKKRNFDKNTRYNFWKEVAQRMHHKNGQFALSRARERAEVLGAASSLDLSRSTLKVDKTLRPEPLERKCQHCGVGEMSTPAMRRGPAGPKTLCNACGLKWANKGTLRGLPRSRRHVSVEQNESKNPGESNDLSMKTEDLVKDDQEALAAEDPSLNLDNRESPDQLPKPNQSPSSDHVGQSALESAMVAQNLWADLRVLSSNFWDLQETPIDFTDFGLPANLHGQNLADESHLEQWSRWDLASTNHNTIL